jgi:hypothetical protein
MSSVIAALMNIGPGFGAVGPVGKLCLYFRCGQVVSFLEHAGRAAGDVQRAGYLLSILLEKIT